MFKHIFINKLKVLFNSKEMLFWNMIFPFILGTFFYVALGNVNELAKFRIIDIGVINNSQYEEQTVLKNVIEELSHKGKNQVFRTKYVTEAKAKKLLENNKIKGYIEVKNKKAELTIKENGIDETIAKSVIDEYYQLVSSSENAIKYNPSIIASGILNNITKQKNYVKDDTKERVDFTLNYFLTLIAMTCLYASLIGLEIIKDCEANLSVKGARICISPVNKFKIIIANMSAGFLVQLTGLSLLFLYIIYVLKIDLGNHLGYTILISVVGSLAGLSLGTFIGTSNKKSENFKIGFLIAIIMLCCFFSGMMGEISMKTYFDGLFPILSQINPINIITDGLYSLYAYDTFTVYYNALARISIFTLIMIGLSFAFIRRKKYDSI